MKYEIFRSHNQGQDQDSGWGSTKEVPFRGRSQENRPKSETDPKGDSESYWPPEIRQAMGYVVNSPSEQPSTPKNARMDTRRNQSSGAGANQSPTFSKSELRKNAEIAKNREVEEYARHRRKLIGLFDWKANQVNLERSANQPEFMRLIQNPDNQNLSPAAEKQIMYDIRDGVIGKNDIKWMMMQITPVHKLIGEQRVVGSINDSLEQQFLTHFSGNGSTTASNLAPGAIDNFVDRYPTPIDFQERTDAMLEEIGRVKGGAMMRAYADARESFMHKIYGKRYEYYRDFMKMQKEASELPPERENHGKALSKNVGYANISKSALRKVNQFLSNQFKNRQEVTRNEYDKTFTEASNYLRKESPETFESCEDSVFIDEANQTYGVFDGAGGIKGGRFASRLASRIVGSISGRFNLSSGRSLADALTIANGGLVRAERNGQKVGVSTGVLAKVINRPDGTRQLAYASAGDSRIYVVHANGAAERLVQDEGVENHVSNFLGPALDRRNYNDAGILTKDIVTGRTKNVTQYGEYNLQKGDRVVLCSDGITGDFDDELLSDREVGSLVSNAKTAKKAAEALLTNARKFDDRSALVIEAYPKRTGLSSFLDRLFKKG